MKLSALLAPLIAAKAPHDQIMAVVMAFEAEQSDALDRRRVADADRQARKRERDKSRDVTLRHSDRSLTGPGDAHGEVKTSNSDIEPVGKNKTRGDAAGFVDALRALLDDERLEALVKHRRSRKAPVTALAARLFIADVEKCGITVAEAADHCISRNWLTVKPDWLAAKPPPRGSPAQRPDTPASVANRLLEEMRSANGQPGTSAQRHQQALVAIPGGLRSGNG